MFRKLRTFLQRRKFDAEMTEEMRTHLEMQVERNIAAGMNPDEARYLAQRQFGNVASIQEQAREERRWVWLEQGAQDLRYSVRQLRRAPGFAVTAISTLALGIGATTAIFSLVNGVMLKPLNFSDPERLVVLKVTHPPDTYGGPMNWALYYRLKERAKSFTSLVAARFGIGNLVGAGDPERATTMEVTPNYFSTLGVRPALGRDFRPDEEEPAKAGVMLLSHVFWQRKFNGKQNVVGRVVVMNDRSYTIVGILPKQEQIDMGAGAFVPAMGTAAIRENYSENESPDVLARLKPGVSLADASREMNDISKAIAAGNPLGPKQAWGIRISSLRDDIVNQANYGMIGANSLLWILFSAVGIVLLISCVNVANLLVARSATRRLEIAMRSALGASRARIVRQLLCESMVLAVIGGVLGIGIAYGGFNALKPFIGYLPRAGEISIDGGVMGFCLVVTILVGVGFGLIPALRLSAEKFLEIGKTNGRQTPRTHNGLLVVEMALALVLLSGAGLLINSWARLQRVNLGYQPEDVFANRLELPAKNYATAQQQTALVDRLLERSGGLPQVTSAAFTSGMPIFGGFGAAFKVAGRSTEPRNLIFGGHSAITTDYFKTLGITLLRGRRFSAQDSAGAPRVAIISEAIAQRNFPNENPLGQKITPTNGEQDWRTIVGVVADVKQWGPASDTIQAHAGQIYEPYAQVPTARNLLLVVKMRGSGGNPVTELRTIIQDVDPNLPLTRLFQLSEGLRYSVSKYRFSTTVGAVFAGLALTLAMIGIYGVISYGISERTREIGVRRALGAQTADILRLIYAEACLPVGIALILGLAGALAGTRLLKSFLFEVGALDPATLSLVVFLMTLVAAFACWLPARRATKIDPATALRSE
jgi:putative ABC transport system permease protein